MDFDTALKRWLYLTQQLKAMAEEERTLRIGLFTGTFPKPKEGANTYTLPNGGKLKGKFVINRNVIKDDFMPARYAHVAETLGEAIMDTVIKFDPGLILSGYRVLSDEQRKVMDTMLEIKPGLPGLEYIPPKDS